MVRWSNITLFLSKTCRDTTNSVRKSYLEYSSAASKVIYTDTSLEFGKSCEDLSWNHSTSTPHRSETNWIAERAVRRTTEGTSAVLLQSGVDEKVGGQIPWTATATCETFKISCLMGRDLVP